MAIFRCRSCGKDGNFTYDPQPYACPRCGSPNMESALGIEEMPDELIDRIVEGLDHPDRFDDDAGDKD